MDNEKKAKVVNLIKKAAKPPRKPRQKGVSAVTISGNIGDGIGIGIGNTIIKTERITTRTIA